MHHFSCCVCLSPCWRGFRKAFTGRLYGRITNVYMLVILGIALGVWLAVKRDTRCLVISESVACRIVIKAKKNTLFSLKSIVQCVCVCTSSCDYSRSISDELNKKNSSAAAAAPLCHKKQGGSSCTVFFIMSCRAARSLQS